MKNKCYYFFLLLIIGCQPSYEEPHISLVDYKLEEGFDLEVIASEPLLKAPIAIDFDAKGRIWVAEMPGFMNNLEGKGEDEPTGTIKILEDLDNDGTMDHAKVFLDNLVLPRALALVYGGLLYAEPPNLWFVEINNDKPTNRILVDSLYAAEGNPEHQPNGLLLNIDNWIYNAKSHFRYQRKNDKWVKEPTNFRGQWGISNDNFGRLYYNDNSRQLLGDHILPNRLVRNKYYRPKYGVNQLLTDNQRVYPLHAALVNRGYAKVVLDKDSLLVNVTAACGPLVYRGGVLSEDYDQNAFVCVPEANLIKRNILSFHGDSTSAKQAWQDKEFLAATDEGFRPVSLSAGPDGGLYIVDMHRGVIGHHAYLSPYLKEKAKEKQLDTIVNAGRILRIKNQNIALNSIPDLNNSSDIQLVELLKDTNGWVRDQAQHNLITKNKIEVIPQLENLANDKNFPLAQIHSLYVLKGLDALSHDLLIEVAESGSSEITSHAIVLLEDFVSKNNSEKTRNLFKRLILKDDKSIDLYLGTTLGVWATASEEQFYPLMYELLEKYQENDLINEAILSGVGESMGKLALELEQKPQFVNEGFRIRLLNSIEFEKANKPNLIFSDKSLTEDTRTKGAKLFRQICSACHGINGEGIQGLAPPLMNSEYVSDHIERLGLIILHGLTGPVHVNGELYDNGQVMPGLLNNENLSDNDISDIISYVSNAFSDEPHNLKPEKIKSLRNEKPKSGNEYTEEELQLP